MVPCRILTLRCTSAVLPCSPALSPSPQLHELVHNTHGPHDSAFYRLLDEYTAECEQDIAREILKKSEDGFGGGASAGRLGGKVRGWQMMEGVGERAMLCMCGISVPHSARSPSTARS